MNTSIDVLAVLDDGARRIESEWWPEVAQPIRDARDAVAELIEASNEMLRVERTQGVTWEEFDAALEALDAALTRVQGGAA